MGISIPAYSYSLSKLFRFSLKKKREKKRRGKRRKRRGKSKEGNYRACANAGPEHAIVTTVRFGALHIRLTLFLGAYFSDYGALGSILQ